MLKYCLGCKKEFDTRRKDKIYCSVKCTKKAWEDKDKKINMIINKCGYCGKEFLTYLRKKRIYCSNLCKTKGWKAKYSPYLIESKKKVCPCCNKKFLDKTQGYKKIYCSKKCRVKIGMLIEKERGKPNKKKYAIRHPEKIREQTQRRYLLHKREILDKNMTYHNKRYKEDIYFNKTINLRRRLIRAIRDYTKTGKIMKSKEYGIDYKKILEHLIKIRPMGVSDKDLMDYHKWHIDHIMPLASFDLNNPEQVREAFKPENHQWLPAIENIKKGKKIIVNSR